MLQRGASRGGAKASGAVLDGDFLSASLTNPELIKRLKVATEKLEGYGDDEDAVNAAKGEIGQLAATLGETWLIKHKNKDVRLLVACALADVLRIYAPDPPYEESTSAEVIKLFIKILRGFENADMTPQNNSYSIHFYLLERLSNISIFSIIPELFNFRDDLLLLLVSSFYDIVNNMVQHSNSTKVTEHMTCIMCSVMEETESYTLELFDIVVGALTQQQKKENPVGCDMMKTVIASCPNNLQPFVENQLRNIKAGFQTESELTQGNRLSEVVFELGTVAPRVLTQVLPAYTDDLTLEDPSSRIVAIKLLGALFSVGNFHQDFNVVFTEFKRRTADKDPDVRRAMVSVMLALVTKRPELSNVFMEESWVAQGETREAPLRALLLDADERVRKDALEAVVELCSQNADTVPTGVLQLIADRIKDKKMIVRHAALEGLSRLYHKYCSPFDRRKLSENATEKFGWIPSKVVGLYYMDAESRATVTRCVEDVCLSSEGSDRPAALVALDFWNALDENGRENMILMMRKRQTFCDNFLKLAEIRNQSMDSFDDNDRSESDVISRLSQAFQEPAKASNMLRKLLDVKAAKVWEAMEGLVTKPLSAAALAKMQEDTLKRLGPKNQTLEAVKTVIAKLSDRFFGVDFVDTLLTSLLSDTKSDEYAQAVEAVSVLPVLADVNARLFMGQNKALESLVLKRTDDEEIAVPLLKALAIAGHRLEELGMRKTLLKRLKQLSASESWEVAKFATRALRMLGQDYSDEMRAIIKSSMASLKTLDASLPSVLCCLSEAARRSPSLLTEKECETVQAFVSDKLLGGSGLLSSSKKDKQIATDAKRLGLTLLASLVLGQADPHETEDPASALVVLTSIGKPVVSILAGIAAGDDESWHDSSNKGERATLRLAAGNVLVKIAKTKHLEHLITPSVFLSMAKICEDKEASVRTGFYKKLYKGLARQHGKLPFRFASMFALAAHDPDAKDVDACKQYMKMTIGLMRTLQKTKNWITLVPEHILPWLVFLIVNHSDYLDLDEDKDQVVIAMKKHLEVYVQSFFSTSQQEHNCFALLHIFEHLKQCEVRGEATIPSTDAKVLQRNVGLCAEMGFLLVKKAGEAKRWTTEGLSGSISKIVEGSLFKRKAGAAPTSFSQQISDDLALSPIRSKNSPAGQKRKVLASSDTPNKRRAVDSSKSPSKAKATAQASKQKARGGKRKAAAKDENVAEEEEEENEAEEQAYAPSRQKPDTSPIRASSRARRSIAATIDESPEDTEATPLPKSAPRSKRSTSNQDADGVKSAKVTPAMTSDHKAAKDTEKVTRKAPMARPSGVEAKRRSNDSAASAFDFDDDDDEDSTQTQSKSGKTPSPSRAKKSPSLSRANKSPPTKPPPASSRTSSKGAAAKAAAPPAKRNVPKGRASASHTAMDLPSSQKFTQESQGASLWDQAISELRNAPAVLDIAGKAKKKRRL